MNVTKTISRHSQACVAVHHLHTDGRPALGLEQIA